MKYSWLIFVWVGVVVLILRTVPAPGTDASRFQNSLTALREEIFYWHESMYIFPGKWTPDWDWYVDINRQIDKFQQELNRLPDSPCAREARAILSFSGPWLAYAEADMPKIEAEWKAVIDKLPLSCEEF